MSTPHDQGFGRGIGGSSGDEVRWQDQLQDRRDAEFSAANPDLARAAAEGGLTAAELQRLADEALEGKP